MTPQEVSTRLRQMASAIENSKSPSIALVRKDLDQLIVKLSEQEKPEGSKR